MANEPFLFYSGNSKVVCSLLRPEDRNHTYFFATDEETRQALAQTTTVKPEAWDSVKKQVQKSGGLLVSAKKYGHEHFQLSIHAHKGKQYKAPTRVLLFGPGGTVEWHPIDGRPVERSAHQFALVPIDDSAQSRLEQMKDLLKDLPEDIRGAILRAIVREDHIASAPVLKEAKNSWAWPILWVLIGSICGAGIYATYDRLFSQEAVVRSERKAHRQALDGPLTTLEKDVKDSPDSKVKAMYPKDFVDHAPDHQSGTLRSEALLVLNLAQYRADKEAAKESPTGSELSIAGLSKLNDRDRNVVEAVSCLSDSPAMVLQSECASIDWTATATGLRNLAEFVNQLSPGSISAAVSTPATAASHPEGTVVSPSPTAPPQAPAGVVTAPIAGTIQNIVAGATSFTFVSSAGDTTYTVTTDPTTKLQKNNADTTIAGLATHDSVTVVGVVTDKKIAASSIVANGRTNTLIEVTGIVKLIQPDKITIISKSADNRTMEFGTAGAKFQRGTRGDHGQLILDGSSNLSVSDIKKGDTLTISYTKNNSSNIAKQLTVLIRH